MDLDDVMDEHLCDDPVCPECAPMIEGERDDEPRRRALGRGSVWAYDFMLPPGTLIPIGGGLVSGRHGWRLAADARHGPMVTEHDRAAYYAATGDLGGADE